MFEFKQIKLGESQSSLSRLTLQGMKYHKIIAGMHGHELYPEPMPPFVYVYSRSHEVPGFSVSSGVYLRRHPESPNSPICQSITYSETIQIGPFDTGVQITSRHEYLPYAAPVPTLEVITDGVVYSRSDGPWQILNKGYNPSTGQYNINFPEVTDSTLLIMLGDLEEQYQPSSYVPIPWKELVIFWQEDDQWWD
jgi:hypothetical protein